MSTCRRALSVLTLLVVANECASSGMVYRTGCCPKPFEIPDAAKKTVDFIEKFGFVAETHEVVTEDGYIVAIHRVLPAIDDGVMRPAVILQHGIASSSILWLFNQERSLPFLLSEAGFDVWLLDTRGNSYSSKHVYLPTTDPNYWRFSFHEQGTLDLAAATDYVRNVTGNEKVFYIGHSRGTTMALVLLSTRPEYNDRFHLVSLYAPVAYIRNIANPVIRVLFGDPLYVKVQTILKALRAYVVPGSSDAAIQFREIICNRTQAACMDIIFAFSGFDYELLNKTMIPIYLSHYPEGGSIQEFIHYLQVGRTDEFRQYDYGREMNLKIYGSEMPPLYDLGRITAPISIHYADNDFFVQPGDLNHLLSQLNSVVAKVRVPFKKFSHTDFQWATKADVYVYRPTIELMKMYLPQQPSFIYK